MRSNEMEPMRTDPNMRRDPDMRRSRRTEMMMDNQGGMEMPRMQNGMARTQKTQTAESVYNTINEHMCKAVAFHEQLADYFCFLGLEGYKKMLEYQYMMECAEKRDLHKRYVEVHQKILPVKQVEIPKFIPSEWSRYTTEDIDDTVISKFVRAALKEWKNWEEQTKELYEEQCDILTRANLVSDCEYVKELILDVEKEIKKVTKLIEKLNGTGYDATMIHGMQDKYQKTYKKMYDDRFTTKNNYHMPVYDRYVPPYYNDIGEEDDEYDTRPRRRRWGFV